MRRRWRGAMLETWRDDVRRARPAAAASIDAYLRDPVAVVRAAGGDFARAALAGKLIDRAGDRHAFDARLAELGGEVDDKADPLPPDQARATMSATSTRRARAGRSASSPSPATIVDGKAGPGHRRRRQHRRADRRGVASGKLKALVVRIDSPGGSVMASEVIRQAILAAKAKGLPVVASMGNVAASGGYWVATPGRRDLRRAVDHHRLDRRVRHPAELPGQLAKLGLGADGIKTTPLSGEPDLLNGPSPEAGALIQAGVESVYRRFLAHRRRVAQEERRPTSTASRRAACGTAAPRGSWGWSTSSAGSTRRSPRPRSSPRLDDDAA